jgi:hypothetical protein
VKDENLKIFSLERGEVLDIPPEGNHPVDVHLRRLQLRYVSDKHHIPYTVKQFRLLNGLCYDENLRLPKVKLLGERVVSYGRDRINEHLGGSALPESINPISQKMSIVRAPSFVHYKNVGVYFGDTGVRVFRNGYIDPVSTSIVSIDTLHEAEGCSITRGLITQDRFGSDNICHFLFDCLGREKAFRLYDGLDNSATLMIPEYQKFCASSVVNKSYYKKGGCFGFDDLYISRDISTDFDEGFSHPANLGSRDIVDALADSLNIGAGAEIPRVYLSRRDSGRRILENELELEEFLKGLGFDCVLMSQLEPKAQVELLRGASVVVAQHGAALTNIISCNPKTKIIELFNPAHGTDAYEIIAKSLSLDYYPYFMGGGSKSQNSIINIKEFSEYLQKVLDD